MALVKTSSMERRPSMLKDFLRDDLSSCSSSGFKSFPRRQCCTTVRFLLEIDLKTKDHPHHKYNTKQFLQRSRSKTAASKTISSLQRASWALLKAVKLLRFPSFKSPPSPSSVQNKSKTQPLQPSSSLSHKKMLRRSLWRKAREREKQTIKRWKMLGEYLEDQTQSSDRITSMTPKTSASSKSESNKAGNDFTADVLQSSSGYYCKSSMVINDDVGSKFFSPSSTDKKPVGNRVGVSDGEDSITNSEENTKNWQSEDEKEQSSPVSVLDCPFEDENDISSPPSLHKVALIEGSKQKLRRIESLAKLEPIDLETRIASFELDNNKTVESSAKSSINKDEYDHNKENETDVKVQELLIKIMKTRRSSNNGSSVMCKAAENNLLSDFFREKLAENNNNNKAIAKTERELLREAEDWIDGQPQGWEVQEWREAYYYVEDIMEKKNEKWWSVGEGKEEVGLALELEIFTSLVNELYIID